MSEQRDGEWQKMVAGDPYDAGAPALTAARERARRLTHRLNSEWIERSDRDALLDELLGQRGEQCAINPPFYCDYGRNIFVGENFYANVGCTILDVCEVHIGDNVLLAPNVQIYTATHSLDYRSRRRWESFGKPVHIGDDCWIGGGVIICPGVSIGPRSVIGAGAVVTRDIPADSLAVGNPARVIRQLTAQDPRDERLFQVE